MNKGTCLQSFTAIRSEPRSGAEMISSLIFGESYQIVDKNNGWLNILTDYDQYSGWISESNFNEYMELPQLVTSLYCKASTKDKTLYIPCGANIPSNNKIIIEGETYQIYHNLKGYEHLPFHLRLIKTAKSFLNTPYLWGGKSFMGIDCSGLVQMVLKTENIFLPRDTSQQIKYGNSVTFKEIKTGDLAFFSSPEKDNVSHVGMITNGLEIIHASGKVRLDHLNEEGIYINNNLKYKLLDIKRME